MSQLRLALTLLLVIGVTAALPACYETGNQGRAYDKGKMSKSPGGRD